MKITKQEIKIRDIVEGYKNRQDNGVVGYYGKLDIRPAYQREFVYKDKQRDLVIDSIMNNYPLNTMYWAKNSDINNYEVLDGQQRTISLCEYYMNNFSFNKKLFANLTEEEQNKFLDYTLDVHVCEGTASEKLAWFNRINVAGATLTDQELRNAAYTGPWLSKAKVIFSKNNCPAYLLSKDVYNGGSPIRQELLENAIRWIANYNNLPSIEEYMARHQYDMNADEIWEYFQNVINWVKEKFIVIRKEMKSIDWGILYNKYHDSFDDNPQDLENIISKLIQDEDVTNKKGIYQYLITKDTKYLNIRTFTDNDKRVVYEKQKGICPHCGNHFEFEEMEGDHITPWSEGGHTNIDNLQMLCKTCNRRKGNK